MKVAICDSIMHALTSYGIYTMIIVMSAIDIRLVELGASDCIPPPPKLIIIIVY